MGNLKESVGVHELGDRSIWKALAAEFLANLLLNFFGCASCLDFVGGKVSYVQVALTFGLVIFVLVQSLGHVSGAHINPAVTAGMMAVGKINIIKGLLYVIVQCLGAIAGSGILQALVPTNLHGNGIGNTQLEPHLSPAQGFGFEFFLGFILVLVVCGVCDENKQEMKSIAALAIGMAVAVGHLATVSATGSSMNPARSLGSAVLANEWANHWIYWVGPMTGGVAASIIYTHLFAAPVTQKYTVVGDGTQMRKLHELP